jgi:hypothetical protein
MKSARGVMPQRLGHPIGTLLLGSPVMGIWFASAPISGTLRGLIGSFSTASVTSHAASGRPAQPRAHRIWRSTPPTVIPGL